MKSLVRSGFVVVGICWLLACARDSGPPPGAPVFGSDPLVVADSTDYSLPGAVIAVDLDQDGDLDLAAVGPAQLLWFENRSGVFQRHALDNRGSANGLLAIDMNADSWPDLVSADREETVEGKPGRLYAWLNPRQKSAPWQRQVLDARAGNYLHDICAADLDNDGIPEIISPRGAAYIDSSDHALDGFMVYKKSSGAGLSAWQRLVLSDQDRPFRPDDFSLAVGDLNGDGFADLAQFQDLWFNPGGKLAETWTRTPWTDLYAPSNLVLADMDRDGCTDLVFAEGHSHRKGCSRIGIWFNRTEPGGEIRGEVHLLGKVAHDPENLAVADLDGNGINDIVTGAMNWRSDSGSARNPSWNDFNGTLVIFLGNRSTADGLRWIQHPLRSDLAALHHLSLVDLDQDGDLDILAANPGARPAPAARVPSVQILWNLSRR